MLRSEHATFKVGDHVEGHLSLSFCVPCTYHPLILFNLDFQEYNVRSATSLEGLRIIKNEEGLPWSLYIGSLGMPGVSCGYGLPYSHFR